MSGCVPTPEQREAVLRDLVRDYAGEANALRKLVRVVGSDRAALEDEVLALVDRAIGRVLREREWATDGREARVAKAVHVGLRLEIRAHFAGEDQ
jgi:hypothetical protein